MGVLQVGNLMGKLRVVIIALLFIILTFLLSTLNTEAASYKEGDILVTSNTGSFGWGFTGHAGIVGKSADGNLYAVHIPGPGKPIQKMTLKDWEEEYPDTEIWRHNNQTAAKSAGQKSMDFVRYYGSESSKYVAPYSLWSLAAYKLTDKSQTYCSKLVWQSYYYGPGLNLGIEPDSYRVLLPYSLIGLPNMYHVSGSI